MIEVRYSKTFVKSLAKLRRKQRRGVVDALRLWLRDPETPSLRRHDLRGEWEGCFSISAGGDLRIHLRWIERRIVVQVVTVGTHSQLYS